MNADHVNQEVEVVSGEEDVVVIETSGTQFNPIALFDDDTVIYTAASSVDTREDEVEFVAWSSSLESSKTKEVSPRHISIPK